MTRYKQYATTAYNGVDFSILHVTPTSPPYPETLNASTYLAIWSKIFQPPTDSDENTTTSATTPHNTDLAMTDALTYATTWLLRLYDDVFPDDAHTPLAHLRNFLAIPQQFVVTCLQYANYSVPASRGGGEGLTGWEGRFALPDDMRTTAVRGRSTTRLLALRWVVWVYIASAGVVVVGFGGVIWGMVVRREGVPGSSGFVEVDLAARFQFKGGVGEGEGEVDGGGEDGGDVDGDGLKVMRELGRAKGRRTAISSSFGVARELRKRRIRVVATSPAASGQGGAAGYESFAFREGVDTRGGNKRSNRLDELEIERAAATEEARAADFQTEIGQASHNR